MTFLLTHDTPMNRVTSPCRGVFLVPQNIVFFGERSLLAVVGSPAT